LIAALEADGQPYRFSHDDLKELLALLNVSPANLSQRMQLVQPNLAGDERTILTVAPTELAERVKAVRGVSGVVLWSVPFETIWFQVAVKKLLETDRQVATAYFQTFGIFEREGR